MTDCARPPILPVTVLGGGPVGLLFACTLARLMPGAVRIQVFDRRWVVSGPSVTWSSETNRRQQVVTLQSREFSLLAPELVDAIFGDQLGEVWPLGPGSVRGLHPRNIRIARLEDALLAQARALPEVEFFAREQDARPILGTVPLIVLADGAHSANRDRFPEAFGASDASVFSLHGQPVVESCLGLRVRSPLSDAAAVVLTAAQRRLLLNPLGGEGYVNLRLTADEDAELAGVLRADARGRGYEQEAFPLERLTGSALWHRLDKDLALFGVDASAIRSCGAFRLDMVMRPRFVAALCEAGFGPWRSYGCLIGDAANAIHFWPGRGINAGLMSAVSLARCVLRHWPKAAVRPGGFRDADFLRHEGVMHMLQYRQKSRAWRAMVMPDDKGGMVPIRDVIARSFHDPVDGQTAKCDRESFGRTVMQVRERLNARLPATPAIAELEQVLEGLDARTLRTLVASGPWDGQSMGGEEVDLESLLPQVGGDTGIG